MLKEWNSESIMFYFNNRKNSNAVYVRDEVEWDKALKAGKVPVSLEHFTIFKVTKNTKELELFVRWLPENIYVVLGRDTVILAFPFEQAPFLLERYLLSRKNQYTNTLTPKSKGIH